MLSNTFFACTVAYYFSNFYKILSSLDINLTEILLIQAKTNKILIKLEKFKEIATKNSTGLFGIVPKGRVKF